MVSPETIKINSTAVITWKFSGKYGELNGLRVENNDSIQTSILSQNRTYTLVVYNETGETISESKTVIVYTPDPPVIIPTKLDTMVNLICLAPWKTISVEKQTDDIWEKLSMSELDARRLWSLTKDGKFKIYDPLDGRIICENVDWNITNDLTHLSFGGRTDSIITLNNSILILYYWIQEYDNQTRQWVDKYPGRRTYVH
jgi:hypothetical protein